MNTAEKGSVSQIKVCVDFTKPQSGYPDGHGILFSGFLILTITGMSYIKYVRCK